VTRDDRRATLDRAIAHFNDPATRERYFELYDDAAVFHGYPPGAERLDGARQFYREAWEANPEWILAVTDVEALDDRLRVRFTYGPHEGVTTLRFEGGKVVERWQGQ
jgi:hypothetical protein